MNIWIGNDHGGFQAKQMLLPLLEELGHTVNDIGTSSTDIVRYPYFAAQVARAVSEGKADRGILICSTGIGMSVIANKFPGIRAALCTSTVMADMTCRHNDSNILCLGGKISGEWDLQRMVTIWLSTDYEGGRHDISLGLIAEAEEQMMTGSYWEPSDPSK